MSEYNLFLVLAACTLWAVLTALVDLLLAMDAGWSFEGLPAFVHRARLIFDLTTASWMDLPHGLGFVDLFFLGGGCSISVACAIDISMRCAASEVGMRSRSYSFM